LEGLVGVLFLEHMAFLQGFDILDDRGGKIGEWFSLPGMNIVILHSAPRCISLIVETAAG
jgi:hypothetical protein